MNYRIIVAAVVHKGNKILLGRRPPGVAPYPDKWQIPGGGVRLGEETTEEALKREIREETGLEVKNLEKIHWDTNLGPNKHGEQTYYIFLVYKCEYAGGELKPSGDMEHFEWVPVDKVREYDHAKPTVALLQKLGYL